MGRFIETSAVLAALALAAVAGCLALLARRDRLVAAGELPARLAAATTIFLGIFLEALPFLLLGTLVSAAIHLWVAPERLRRWIPRGPLSSALAGVLFGLTILPVCECGTVPPTRRLLAKGAPLPFGLAYLLAAPAINPVVIASTRGAFNGSPVIVFGRIGLTLVIALIVGILVGTDERERVLLPAARPPTTSTATGTSAGRGGSSPSWGTAPTSSSRWGAS